MSAGVDLELKLQREREGRCGNCGTDTHETAVAADGRVVRRGPGLTIINEVHRGRCLFCYPFNSANRPASASLPAISPSPLSPDVGSQDFNGSDDESKDEEAEEAEDALSRRTPPMGRVVLSSGSRRGRSDSRGEKRDEETMNSENNGFDVAEKKCKKKKKRLSELSSPRKIKKAAPRTEMAQQSSADETDDCMGPPSVVNLQSKKKKEVIVSPPEDSKKSKSRVAPREFVKTVISEATRRPQSAALQDKSIEKLRTSFEAEEDKRGWVGAIVEAGGVEMILEAMKNHRNKAAVQFEGCKMLANIAWAGDDSKIASNGGIDAVLRSMKHTKSGKIAEAGMEALVNLSTKPALRAQIIEQGGLEVVSSGLSSKQRNAKLQAEGCNFFLNLASRGDVDNAIKISNAGVIPLIIAAVKNHPNFEDLVQTACEALQNLAVSNEIRQNITDSGGVDLILDLMDTEVERLQESVLDVLKNLTTDHSSVQLEVALAGGIPKTINLMKEFPDNHKLIEKACVVLQNLSSQTEAVEHIVKHNGVKEVIIAMKKHKTSAKVQEETCLLLWKMCAVPSVASILKSDEMQDYLKEVAKKFPQKCGTTVKEIQRRVGKRS